MTFMVLKDKRNMEEIEPFNATEASYPYTGCSFSSILRERAEQMPAKTALIYGDRRVSYKDFADMAEALAGHLVENEVKPGDFVGIYAERSVEMIVAIYAVLRAGAVYVPLSPMYEKERLDYILEDCKPKAILTYGTKLESSVYSVSLEKFPFHEKYKKLPDTECVDDQLIYCIYTSGTTGRPKGVMNYHKGLLNVIQWMQSEFPLGKNDVILQKTTFVFDVSASEILWFVLAGATLSIAEPGVEKDPGRMIEVIEKDHVTVIDFVPSMLSAFLMIAKEYGNLAKCLGSLRYVMAAGEALYTEVVNEFYEVAKQNQLGMSLVNIYGPTEASIYSSYCYCSEGMDKVPIGKPIGNGKLYIIRDGVLCGIGETGELCIAGAGVAKGYLNLEELTQEKFTVNPFGEGTLYHSGDLARWMPDGKVEYLGRMDSQVKIRGYRIELGEVENAFRRINGIRDVAVIVKENQNGDKMLAAFYVADYQWLVSELRSELENHLPVYMLPSFMVRIEEIPVTTNGKLDRRALDQIELVEQKVYVEPVTEEEELICTVFGEVLGKNRVSTSDNFISLGGDSIKAIRVMSKIRESGYEIGLARIMEEGTIAEIAAGIFKKKVEYEQGEFFGKVEATPIIKTFQNWHLKKEEYYNQSIMMELNADPEDICDVLNTIYEHHDMLRGVYRNGTLEVLSIAESEPVELKCIEIDSLENDSEEVTQFKNACNESFDLEKGPLLKAIYFMGEKKSHLFLCAHHLIMDGVSWRILLDDLSTGLSQMQHSKNITFMKKTASFKQWSEANKQYAESDTLKREESYWKDVENRLAEGGLSFVHEKAERCYQNTEIYFTEEMTANLLHNSARTYHTGMNDLLLAALGKAVRNLTGQHCIAVGMEGHGREKLAKDITIDRTVGWFTSMYPVVLQTYDDIETQIVNTKEMLRAVPNRGVGYGILRGGALFNADIFFNYLGVVDGTSILDGLSVADCNRLPGIITMNGEVSGKVLRFVISYDGYAVETETIQKFARAYQSALEDVVTVCMSRKEEYKTISDYDAEGLQDRDFSLIQKRYPGVEEIIPLTPLQEGILFHCNRYPETTAYQIQAGFTLEGELEREILKQAIAYLVQNHSSLHSAIYESEWSGAYQIVCKDKNVPITYMDYRHLKDEEKEKHLAEFLEQNRLLKFELDKGPLIRAACIQREEKEYQFILTFHHIAMDGWSISIFMSELQEYYKRLLTGAGKEYVCKGQKEKKCGQFKDYSRLLQTRDYVTDKKYWKQLLSEYDGNSIIHSISNISEERNLKQKAASTTFNKERTALIHTVLASCHLTMSNLMEGAWGILLKQYNNVDDVLFAKMVSGREVPLEDIDRIIGMFVNTVPVRLQLSNDESMLSIMQKIQKQSNASSEYSACSLPDVMQDAGLEADMLRTLVVYENYPDALNAGEQPFTYKRDFVDEETSYDITVRAGVYEGELTIELLYNPVSYHNCEVDLILTNYVGLINRFVNNPDILLKNVDMCSAQDKQKIDGLFNRSEFSCQQGRTIIQALEDMAAKTPDRNAILFKDRILSYRQFNEKANGLAYNLQSQFIGPGDFVVILAQRSMEMVLAIFAVLKTGAAYVPVSVDYPQERIQYIVNDCKPKAILVYQSQELENVDVPVLDLEQNSMWEGETSNLGIINKGTDPIYCIYTSGTTGKPKGVVNQHKGLWNLISWMQKEYPLGKEDAIMQKTTYVFDVSASELFWWCYAGASLVIPEPEVEKDPVAIAEAIERYGVTVIDFVPSMLSAFLGSISHNETLLQKIRGLKHVIAAGEALTVGIVDEFYQVARKIESSMKLANIYGPTEASIYSAYYNCHEHMESVPIGKPVGNAKLYILQGNKQCGIGIPGELCITGEGVAKGYLNLPELTAQKFVENPYGEGVMYRSGDLAYWNYNGDIEYLGRIDSQVKIRGFRIELGEVETAVRRYEAIKECAVIARKDSFNENALFCYYVADQQISITRLKEWLKEYIPDYMIPGYMMQIDEIPITNNGKLNRRMLPEITVKAENTYLPPRNETEEALCSLYQEILGVERVGVQDDFFALGGHSLRATRLVNRINGELCSGVSLRMIFAKPTVEEMAKLIHSINSEKDQKIPYAVKKTYYPMSSPQKRIYLVTRMAPDGVTYNIPQNYKLMGELDTTRFYEAYKEVVFKHEILRTGFEMRGDELIQVIYEERTPDYEYVEHDERSDEEIMESFVAPFDLKSGSLVRIKLVKRQGYMLLLLDMHHIITDGVSIGLFFKELARAYNGEEDAFEIRQYKDYSEWMLTRDLSKERAYWIEQFKEHVPALKLPTDYKRPAVQRFQGALVRWKIADQLNEKVQKLCGQNGFTEYMVYLGSLMVLLSRYGREEEIAVGSPISARSHEDMEHMLGMFVNTLVMRAYPKAEKPVMDFLQEVKKVCLEAYENQEYPFEELIEQIDVVRDFTRNALFDVSLAVQNFEEQVLSLEGITCKTFDRETTVSKFDLSFNVCTKLGEHYLEIEYDTDLYQEETIHWMGQHFLEVVQKVVDEPEQLIGRIEMTTEKEKQFIDQFNDTGKTYDKNKTVVHIWEEQVAKYPDCVALSYEGKTLTYAEMEEKTRVLKNQLKELGIGRNDKVVVYARRGVEMFLGIFATLRAGAAYIPVAPDWPEKRIQFILEDCEPKAILTYGTEFETELLDKMDMTVIDLADESCWTGDSTKEVPVNEPEDLAYCIYTSGTTGTPKGVMIPHKGLAALRCYLKDTYEVTPKDRVLQFANYVFDASVWEWALALLHGAALVIVPEDVIQEEERFCNFVKKYEISLTLLPPQYYLQMPVEGLRILTTGGSASSYEVASKALQKGRYINAYGPTENTVLATGWEGNAKELPDIIPIGKPVANTKLYILNGLMLCGIGVPGELCIAGDALADGYVNLPELTEEKFIPNPFGEGKLYRTGDLARWLPDGNVVYMGRIDEQVKIRGFRIELGEIEAVIRKMEYVKDAAVIVVDEEQNASIAAYVVLNKDGSIEPEEIRNELRQYIPEYMVPAYLVQVDVIPVTSSGKVDKRALSKLERHTEQEVYVAPKTDLEKLVCEMFEEVLGQSPIGAYDSFYELGGDSIKAIRIISKLRSTGYSVTSKDIMRYYTPAAIAQVASRIENAYSQEEVNGLVPETPIFREFAEWKFAKPEHFNQSALLPVEDASRQMVDSILHALTCHYDMLRLVYREGRVEILSSTESPLYDLEEHVLEQVIEQNEQIENICSRLQESIDLEHGPIVKSALFHTEYGNYLFLAIHHFAVDGVSWRILTHDIYQALDALKKGRDIRLTEKTASFIQWAKELERYGKSEEVLAQIDYWQQIAEQSVESELEELEMELNLVTEEMIFSEEDSECILYEAQAASDTKPQELFLAALGATMYEVYGMEAVTVFMEGHGRDMIQKELSIVNTVGWFTSLYPVRIESSEDMEQDIQGVKEMLQGIPDGGIGYGVLKEKLSRIKPQISFNYLGEMDNENDMFIGIGKNIADENTLPYRLSINGYVVKNQIHFSFTIDDNWMDESLRAFFMETYQSKVVMFAKICSEGEENEAGSVNLEGFELEQNDLDTIFSMLQEDD